MAGNTTAHLLTSKHEFVKQFIEYDGSARMVSIYEARADAADGSPCMKTSYAYVTGTTRIEKRKEEEATWDSSWDI